MSLMDLVPDKMKEHQKSTSEESYPDKMLDKPDPESFKKEREDHWAVGPPLSKIGGIERLIKRMDRCETVKDWSILLNKYIRWGNNKKVSSSIGIFNLNSAHDCVNRWSPRCQVTGQSCYSVRTEQRYPYSLDYYRRQEYLWDSLDSQTFAQALLLIIQRKRIYPTAIKFSQAGDFRHDGDVIKANYIADQLKKVDVPLFTYSASSHLNWGLADSDNFIVNRSNSGKFGDRRFRVIGRDDDPPRGEVRCPYDLQKSRGLNTSERIKCGECLMCMDTKAPNICVTHGRPGR